MSRYFVSPRDHWSSLSTGCLGAGASSPGSSPLPRRCPCVTRGSSRGAGASTTCAGRPRVQPGDWLDSFAELSRYVLTGDSQLL